jgi:hypothetical protein
MAGAAYPTFTGSSDTLEIAMDTGLQEKVVELTEGRNLQDDYSFLSKMFLLQAFR